MDYTTPSDNVKGQSQIIRQSHNGGSDNRWQPMFHGEQSDNTRRTLRAFVSEVCPFRCGKIAGNFASDNQSPITPLAAACVSCRSSAGFCKFPKCGESASFRAYAKIRGVVWRSIC